MGTGRKRGRKLLVASAGVATVSYVMACSFTETSGNLMGPDPEVDAGSDASEDASEDAFIGSGNLVAPEPEDGGDAAPPED